MSKANSDIFNAKILIIGDSTVGKTSILIRWAENVFSLNHRATIGVDFREKSLQISGKNINVQIWDTAGQERFRNMTKTFYQGAMGIFLAYDCTSEASFNNIHNWIQQIYTHASLNVCKILIGNKADLPGHIF